MRVQPPISSLVSRVLFAAVLLALFPPGTRVEAQEGAFLESLDVNVVNVEVFVTDKKDLPIEGLKMGDFEILEDGKKVKPTHFRVVDGAPASGEPQTAPDLAGSDSLPVTPAHYIIFVDNFTIEPHSRKQVLAELREVVEGIADPAALYAIASYDGHLHMRQPFTGDRELILAAIDGLEELSPLGIARRKEHEAILREGLRNLRSISRTVQDQTRDSETARYLAAYSSEVNVYAERVRQEILRAFYSMSHLVNALAAIPGRKAVIYVSDGMPMRPGEELHEAISVASQQIQIQATDTGLTDEEAQQQNINNRSAALDAMSGSVRSRRSTTTRRGEPANNGVRELAALANSGQVSFYALRPVAAGGLPAEFEGDLSSIYTPQVQRVRDSNNSETLQVIAEQTGGQVMVGAAVGELLARAASDFSSYYSLGYSPNHSGDGKYHQIEVKVSGRGNQVRHRKGYVDKPRAAHIADRTSAALLFGVDDNAHGLDFEVVGARPAERKGEWVVPVRLTIPLAEVMLIEEGGVYGANGQLFVAALDQDGATAAVQGFDVRIEVPGSNLESLRGQSYTTGIELLLREGQQRLALGFVEPASAVASFVSRDIMVGP